MKGKKGTENLARRPEEIIVGTDPVAIEIIQQIYSALKDIKEEDRTFQERCWVLGIEKAYKNDTKKLDPELCSKLLERIYYHLEHKNIWEAKEEYLYEIFEKIISLKTVRDSRVKEVFDNLEKALTSALQLDFSNRVELYGSVNNKRNIFNYMVLFFNTIIEKIETSMVSVKAMNAFFSVYPELILVITNDSGKVRYINQAGMSILNLNAEDSFVGMDIKNILKNASALIAKRRTERKIIDFETEITTKNKKEPAIKARVTMPEIVKDRSEISELVFIIKLETY